MSSARAFTVASTDLRTPDRSGPGREAHDGILRDLDTPPFLVEGRRPVDDVYLIRTDDPRGRVRTLHTIDFRVPVLPGPVLLTDAGYEHDLLTAKLYVLHGLGTGRLDWTTSAYCMTTDWLALLNLIRWRIQQGLRRMEGLTRPWVELFIDHVRRGGRLGLLPHEERVAAYLAEVESGREVLPVVNKGRRVLAVNEVARRLGVTTRHQIPIPAWQPVLDLLARLDPAAHRNTVRNAKRVTLLADAQGEPGGAGLIPQQVFEILQPLERLWSLREVMAHDPVPYRAFDQVTTCMGVAHGLSCKPVGRTPLPPVDQVCALVDGALRLVLACEAEAGKLQAVVEEGFRLHPRRGLDAPWAERTRAKRERRAFWRERLPERLDAFGRAAFPDTAAPPLLATYHWRRQGRGELKPGTDARDLLFVLLPAACAVVVATFSARRNTEISSLREDSIVFDEHGNPCLTTWIEKTLRAVDRIPVPASVVRAVEVLRRLSLEARRARGEEWLFSLKDPGEAGASVDFDMSQSLKALAAFLGVPPLPDGSAWDFQPHQFRVFFGVVYYWVYDYPSLTALSSFFRHFDPTTTRGYVTQAVQGSFLRLVEERRAARRTRAGKAAANGDETRRAVLAIKERGRDFEEVRQEFLLEVARGAADGDSPLRGFGGETWNRELAALVEGLSREVQIAPAGVGEASLDVALRAWIKGRHLEPHPAGHSFCKCGPALPDLAAAACLAVKAASAGDGFDLALETGPDHAHAADETCAGCPHNVQRPVANRLYWEGRIAEADHAAAKAATDGQRRNAAARAARLRDHHARCFGDLEDQQ